MKAEERARKAVNGAWVTTVERQELVVAVRQAIREAEQSAREEEREACKQIAAKWHPGDGFGNGPFRPGVEAQVGQQIAAAIRARNGS